MDLTRQIAEYAVGLRLADMPDDVVATAKAIILDTMGSALAGTSSEGVSTLRETWSGNGEASRKAAYGFWETSCRPRRRFW